MKLWEVLIIKFGLWFGAAAILAFWTRYELSFWLTYAKGVPTQVEWWKAFLISLLLPIALFLDFVSFIVRLFV
jgi:hypothetical protein